MARASAVSSPLHVRFGEFELDEPNALLLRGGAAIALSPTPFGVLCALARHPGELLTKHALLDEVWGHRCVSDSVLKGAISDVRTILHDDPQHPRFIETVPRRGYRFIAASTGVSSTPPSSGAAGDIRVETDVAEQASASTRARPVAPPHDLFVGRATELASLRRAWASAASGKRTVFWIAGEPGIGKTTLIDRFVYELGDIVCARGHCVQHYGSGEPYHPVLEALAELCRIDTEAPSLLRALAPTWLLQLPWLSTVEQREALLRELVGVNLERMLREMGEFLDRYTEERRPLLLVTSDLHWGDRATIQLIDYLARRRSRSKLMWLSSFRLAQVIATDHPLNALRHELHLHGLCEEIVLDSFSEAEVAAYVAERSPSMASDETFVRALHERTEGVPLFVASVMSDVAARSAQDGIASAARLANSPVPENLYAIIDHFVANLGDEPRLLLSAASVYGLHLRISTLARVLERDALWVADACDQLLREQTWLVASRAKDQDPSSERPYSFRHALFRQVLYDRLAPSARAELHRKVGAALEQERGMGRAVPATELAMHFERGRAPLSALRYYAEAAQAALLHVSPADCMSLTHRALSLLNQAPAGVERTSLEIELATLRGVAAFHLLGAGEEARSAYQRGSSLLADVPRHAMRGLLLHGLGFLHNLRGEYGEALATAQRADALASANGDAFLMLAACTVRGHAYMHLGRPHASRESLERALPAAASVHAASQQTFIGFIADPEVTVLAMLSFQLAHLGLIGEMRVRLRQAYTRARGLAQPMALMVTMWYDALCEIRFGDVDRVAALADELHSLVEQFALAQGKAACRWFRAWADARRGKPLESFRQIRAAYEENRALGMVAGSSETLGYAAEALVLHGDWRGAEEQLQEALDIVNTYGERIYLPQLLLTEGAIARARGQHADADASIRRAIMEARAQGALWPELLALTELCKHATASADDHHRLGALVDRLDEARGTTAFDRAAALIAGGLSPR
jgi:DNA-binding winged helix-turn-helix (wHTH) protein/tetratricopeptide (TPR) repeat protein